MWRSFAAWLGYNTRHILMWGLESKIVTWLVNRPGATAGSVETPDSPRDWTNNHAMYNPNAYQSEADPPPPTGQSWEQQPNGKSGGGKRGSFFSSLFKKPKDESKKRPKSDHYFNEANQQQAVVYNNYPPPRYAWCSLTQYYLFRVSCGK